MIARNADNFSPLNHQSPAVPPHYAQKPPLNKNKTAFFEADSGLKIFCEITIS
jgi:hypothetical protein